jgi:hypothetical protein
MKPLLFIIIIFSYLNVFYKITNNLANCWHSFKIIKILLILNNKQKNVLEFRYRYGSRNLCLKFMFKIYVLVHRNGGGLHFEQRVDCYLVYN